MLCDVLHQLLLSILRVKPSQEVKSDGFLLWNLLIQNLHQRSKQICICKVNKSISVSWLLHLFN